MLWLKEDIIAQRNLVRQTQLYECRELLGDLLDNLLEEVSVFLVRWLMHYTGEDQEAKHRFMEVGLRKLDEFQDRARLCDIYFGRQHKHVMLEDIIKLKPQ